MQGGFGLGQQFHQIADVLGAQPVEHIGNPCLVRRSHQAEIGASRFGQADQLGAAVMRRTLPLDTIMRLDTSDIIMPPEAR